MFVFLERIKFLCRYAPQAPRPRKRPAQVLDEDVYTDNIEAIIERDYFPDLPKLRNKLDWLEAVRSGALTPPLSAHATVA